jgi:hypothetical protein
VSCAPLEDAGLTVYIETKEKQKQKQTVPSADKKKPVGLTDILQYLLNRKTHSDWCS